MFEDKFIVDVIQGGAGNQCKHEHEWGYCEQGKSTRGEETASSERRREYESEFKRHFPHGDAYRRRACNRQ